MTYRLIGELSVKKVADEVFVLNRRTSEMCSFNRTGANMFECLQQGETDIPALLAGRFEVPEQQAREDVEEFLRTLASHSMVIAEEDRPTNGN